VFGRIVKWEWFIINSIVIYDYCIGLKVLWIVDLEDIWWERISSWIVDVEGMLDYYVILFMIIDVVKVLVVVGFVEELAKGKFNSER